jgi:hypothetical protein
LGHISKSFPDISSLVVLYISLTSPIVLVWDLSLISTLNVPFVL